jgi:hypothetical protein
MTAGKGGCKSKRYIKQSTECVKCLFAGNLMFVLYFCFTRNDYLEVLEPGNIVGMQKSLEVKVSSDSF